MKTSRRSHPKTRTGCKVCKARKIKCDEKRPACTNCIRHSVQCDFTPIQSPAAYVSPETRSPYIYDPSSSTSSATGNIPNPSTSNGLNDHPMCLNVVDLELLHNFTTSTCNTLSSNPVLQNLWRINVPQLGFSHYYVLRGILAVSALHLARFRPEKSDFYVSQAMLHHEGALRVVTSLLLNITDENCSALYMFSAITCTFALGSPRKPGDFLLVADTGVTEWLLLLRGARSIVEIAHDTLCAGPVGAMFSAGQRRDQLRAICANHDLDKPFGQLRDLINTTVTDERASLAYNDCIDELRRSFNVLYDPSVKTFETTDVFIWAYRVNDEYLALLRESTQEALAIFAFFCVLLRKLEHYWWIEGWSGHLLSHIHKCLDQEHRLWIRWPVEEIGWVPNPED